jgi:hypothetical protein
VSARWIGSRAEVTYLGIDQRWPRSAATLNALAAAVVVGIGGVFVVHARAPRR